MEHLSDSAGPRKSIILIGGISVPVEEGKWGDWNDVLNLSMPLGTAGIDGCVKCGGKECGGRRRCLRILRYVADCIENVPEVTRREIASAELSDQGRPGPDLSPAIGVRDRVGAACRGVAGRC